MTEDANIETKIAPEMANEINANVTPQKQETKTIIHKRGGVGFFTALLMSSAAAIGGAYLGLYINARPDVVQSLKLTPFLPKAKMADNLISLNDDITKIKNDIAALQKVNIGLPIVPKTPNVPIAPQTPTLPENTNNANVVPPIVPQNPPQQIANLDPLKAQINGLSGRLTAIETRLAALDPTGTGGAIIAALQAEIATLKVNFEALNKRISQTPSPAVTFAVISLAEAANKNGAFVPEFEAVRAALPNLPEVFALEALAKTGAPTRSLLETEFDNIIKQGVEKAEEVKKQTGVLGWFKNLFSGLVKVKVKDTKETNSVEMVYERAKIKLIAGDLNGAVQELNSIAEKTPELVKWLNGAGLRMDLEAKIGALRGAIERGLSVSVISQTGANGQLIAPKSANDILPITNQIATPVQGNVQ